MVIKIQLIFDKIFSIWERNQKSSTFEKNLLMI